MKNLNRLAAGLVMASGGLISTPAHADVSYNMSWASEYYFRGILQKTSSASVGIDYTDETGFYVGSWAADVGDGLEVDAYAGYAYEWDSGLSASVGFTGYYYTGKFDDEYEEANFNLGYNGFALEYSVGEWEGFGMPVDYDFLGVTYTTPNGFYGTYGTFGDMMTGDYVEVGWNTTISGIDFGIAGVFSDDAISPPDSRGEVNQDEAVVFTISKSF